MEGTEENAVTALRIEKLPCSDDIDNIKDDKLVKKIKEMMAQSKQCFLKNYVNDYEIYHF